MNFYSDLQILAGGIEQTPRDPIVLDARAYYCIQYNHRGKIMVSISGAKPRWITGPSVLITCPGCCYSFGSTEGWHHNYISFKGERVQRYIDSGLLPVSEPIQRIRDGDDFLRRMIRCLDSLRFADHANASHELEGLLLQLQGPWIPLASREKELDQKLKWLAMAIKENPIAEWDFQDQSRQLHISYVQFRRLFRQLHQLPPARFLQRSRLSWAGHRLLSSQDPIKQVAASSRVGTLTTFSRCFSKAFGLPPGQYRQAHHA